MVNKFINARKKTATENDKNIATKNNRENTIYCMEIVGMMERVQPMRMATMRRQPFICQCHSIVGTLTVVKS